MPSILPEIEVYPVHHLPILKAYADQLGLVSLINHYVPTEMEVDAGTVVLGLVLDTLSGRSPLYRLEEFFAHQDTELLLGKALPVHAFTDDTVGRVLDRLYDFGTMRLFTDCAVRAVMRFDLERRYVHFDTTSRSVWGEYQFAETQDLPFQMTYGYSKDKRPDLKQFVLSSLCVERAVPIWGKPEDGNASDKTLNATLLSEITQRLACYGVQPGAYIYIADAALGDGRQSRCSPGHLVQHPPPRHLQRMWTGHCGGCRRQRLGGGGRAGPDAPDEAPAGDLL